MQKDELKYMVWLSHMYGTNMHYIDILLERFKSASGLYHALCEDLKSENLIPNSALSKIIELKKNLNPDEVLANMQAKNIQFIHRDDCNYPPMLRQIHSPPLGLFMLGKMPGFDRLWVSIIGTRRHTDYGKTVTHNLSKELALKGVVIVSGMAEGLDAVASHASLEAKAPTVVVLGSGVDICYPKINEKLYENLLEDDNACILSEFPPGVNADKWHFPLRNRIISALSLGVIVTEAEVKSGTSITVNYALEQGREVMAVPGNITSKRSTGTNKLIKEGAHVVTCALDVLDALGVIESENLSTINEENQNIMKISLAPDEKRVYALLEDNVLSLDEIVAKDTLSAREIMVLLKRLEVSGLIRELPGQKYIRQ